MDADEVLVLLVCSAVTVAATVRWYGPLLRRPRWAGRPVIVAALALTPPVCLLVILAVLQTWADAQVRGHVEYLALFLVAGGTWLAGTAVALPVVLGVSVRDDALDRRNAPAAAVAGGAMVAVTTVYAAANVGTGGTIWTTLGPAAAGTAALAAVALAHAAASRLSESITVGRDPATAARAVGLHLALAAVLAAAVAGNWVSLDATLADFARRGWPVVPMAAAAAVVDRRLARRRRGYS